MMVQTYVLMENAKTNGKERRGNDKPIKVSRTPIYLEQEILNTKKYWYSVHMLAMEDKQEEPIELGDPFES
jgi:hypothetical protein